MSQNNTGFQPLPQNTILKGLYLVEACIGHGGFGITYRAAILPDRREKVAIKEYFPRMVVERVERGKVRVRPDAEKDFSQWRENYEREYRLLLPLRGNHGIVGVRETFQENCTSYLVMDYIPGETMEARVRRQGPFRGEEIESMIRDFLPEIAKMHRAGILHRDINPGNIMLEQGKMPRLIDFGSARPIPREGGRLTTLIRPGFAPPEQYRDRSRQGPESDVYGLCASLYFALTGVIPPDGKQRLIKDEMIPLGKLCAGPEKLTRAISRGLNPIPEKRPKDFEALWREIYGENRNESGRPAANSPEKTARIQQRATEQRASQQGQREDAAEELMKNRLRAASKAARLLRIFSPEKYDAVLASLDRTAAQKKHTAQDRAALEDSILAMGKPFWLLTAMLTRTGDEKTGNRI